MTSTTAERGINHWRDMIESAARKAAKPLKFCQAMGDDMPLPLEVVRNDARNVVIHIFRRPDIPQERAESVVKKALAEVFGQPGDATEMFYRDEKEIARAEGLPHPVLPSDSWYIEFATAMSDVLPDVGYLRDKLSLAVKNAWRMT